MVLTGPASRLRVEFEKENHGSFSCFWLEQLLSGCAVSWDRDAASGASKAAEAEFDFRYEYGGYSIYIFLQIGKLHSVINSYALFKFCAFVFAFPFTWSHLSLT